jgi:hypothetical protein
MWIITVTTSESICHNELLLVMVVRNVDHNRNKTSESICHNELLLVMVVRRYDTVQQVQTILASSE